MKECKCERRLSNPLDPPSEETLQRCADVVEHYLNMSRELNRKSTRPIEVTEEHIKIINRFMEDKKTIKEWKEAFADLYMAMRKELGASGLDVRVFQHEVKPIVTFDIRF